MMNLWFEKENFAIMKLRSPVVGRWIMLFLVGSTEESKHRAGVFPLGTQGLHLLGRKRGRPSLELSAKVVKLRDSSGTFQKKENPIQMERDLFSQLGQAVK